MLEDLLWPDGTQYHRLVTETPTLQNGGITLRPTAEADTSGIAQAGRDPAIRRNSPWFGEGFQDSWAEAWVRRAIEEWAGERNRVFSILDVAGRYLGSVVASPTDGAVQIAYWVLPESRGKGVATGAVMALLPWVRETFPKAHLWAQTRPDNSASQRVLTNCGFVETRRQDLVHFEWRGANA